MVKYFDCTKLSQATTTIKSATGSVITNADERPVDHNFYAVSMFL